MSQQLKRPACAPVVALACAIFAAAGGGTPLLGAEEITPERAAAIRQGVEATLAAYRDLGSTGRVEDLLRLYADDPSFRWVSRGTVEARSVAELRRSYSALAPGTRIETTFQDTEITPLSPQAAVVTTLFRTRVVDPQGKGFSFEGALTMTLVERQGGWKILLGHSSGRPEGQPREDLGRSRRPSGGLSEGP